MKSSDLVVLGLNGRVIALLREDGSLRRTTDLPGFMDDGFVTVACDDARAYAFARGRIHCLDLESGRILWSNELEGFGYGNASVLSARIS